MIEEWYNMVRRTDPETSKTAAKQEVQRTRRAKDRVLEIIIEIGGTSGMTDEEIREAQRDINKSEEEQKKPQKPKKPEKPKKMLTLVSVKYANEKFEIRKPDGTTESYDNDTETFDALDRITITEQMVEDALKKESDSYKPFKKLILDTLRPTSGEILVTDRKLLINNKVNDGGEEENQALIKQLLSLKQATSKDDNHDFVWSLKIDIL